MNISSLNGEILVCDVVLLCVGFLEQSKAMAKCIESFGD
jgi:hypothetical protein